MSVSEPAATDMKLVTKVTTTDQVAAVDLVPEASKVEDALGTALPDAGLISANLVTTTTATFATSTSPATTTSSAVGFGPSTTSESYTSTTSLSDACVELKVQSAGGADGNYAKFYLDGKEVELASGRGLSLVILTQDGQVESKHVYDTGYQADGSAPLAELLNSLAEGTPILVAAMDDASENLTTQAKDALKTLGATKADQIGYRYSYALVGIKGQSAIAEALSASGEGAVELTSSAAWMASCGEQGSPSGGPVAFRITSAGGLDGNIAEFYVDGSKIELEVGRGLSIVVLGETGNVVSKHVYDTGYQAEGSGPLTELLNSLPDGTLVLMAAMDDASESLTAEAKAAITAFGATKLGELSYRGSYALIGVKRGAAIAEKVAASGEGPVTIEESLTLPLGLGAFG